VIPDAGTAAAAMQSGEMDWWEAPTFDLLPLLKRDAGLTVPSSDQLGYLGNMRLIICSPRSTIRRCGGRCWGR
jgi:peptide/nickel transport system substrate-binding protein